jgi:Cys-tRNA(Pro)/Cys-tRNA(Cys) deacylase
LQTRVTEILDKNKIKYKVKPHSRKVYTCEEAAVERGVKVKQIVKCIIVKDRVDDFYIVLLPGDKKLNLKKLAKILNQKKMRMASKKELERITGYTLGAVSPIGIKKKDTQFYFDRSILDEEYIDISSGRADAGIELSSVDLLDLLKPQVVDITE